RNIQQSVISLMPSEDPQNGVPAEVRQDAAHVGGAKRNTTLGRQVVLPCQMKKDRRPAISPPRRDVPVKHDADIIELVRSRQALMACGAGGADAPVVGGMSGGIAPQHVGADGAERQRGARSAGPVVAIETFEE